MIFHKSRADVIIVDQRKLMILLSLPQVENQKKKARIRGVADNAGQRLQPKELMTSRMSQDSKTMKDKNKLDHMVDKKILKMTDHLLRTIEAKESADLRDKEMVKIVQEATEIGPEVTVKIALVQGETAPEATVNIAPEATVNIAPEATVNIAQEVMVNIVQEETAREEMEPEEVATDHVEMANAEEVVMVVATRTLTLRIEATAVGEVKKRAVMRTHRSRPKKRSTEEKA
jgi:hypothetical protein